MTLSERKKCFCLDTEITFCINCNGHFRVACFSESVSISANLSSVFSSINQSQPYLLISAQSLSFNNLSLDSFFCSSILSDHFLFFAFLVSILHCFKSWYCLETFSCPFHHQIFFLRSQFFLSFWGLVSSIYDY